MRLRVLDDTIGETDVAIGACLPQLPRLLALAAGCRALLRPVLVPEGATPGSQDHIGVTQVLEEGRQSERVHTARNDGCGLLHALPLLMVIGTVSLILLQHVRNALVRRIALHLAEAHGADVDAAGTDDPGDLRVHEGGVAALRLRARHGTVSSTVVVQELLREIAACNGHCGTARDVAIHKEGAALRQGTELREHVLATRNHFIGIIRGDVCREQLRLTSFFDAGAHGLHHLRDALVHLTEDLVALRLIVLDEIAAHPERIACLAKGLGLQAQLWLDNGAHNEATILGATAKDAPHVDDAARGTIKETQVHGWEVHIVDFAVLNIAHALVVADRERQDGAHHGAPVCDVAVEEHDGVSDLHLFVLGINIIDERINRLREVIRGANIHIGARRGLSREVCRSGEVIIPSLWFHDVRHQHMVAILDQIVLHKTEVRITARLVESPACDGRRCPLLWGNKRWLAASG